jgi:pyridoxamine 5'-phosphate oxidase
MVAQKCLILKKLMLLHPTDTLSEMLQKVQLEFTKACKSKKHPFRYVVFGTVLNQKSDLRYVVLRDYTDDGKLVVFTDLRSNKIKAIQENPTVSLLFYHPRKGLQVKVEGSTQILTEGHYFNFSKQRVQGDAKKAYSSKLPPSIKIKNWEDGHGFSPENEMQYFCVVTVEPNAIEVLQLSREQHIRFIAEKNSKDWDLSFLNP